MTMTLNERRTLLVHSLRASKSWMTAYAEAFVDEYANDAAEAAAGQQQSQPPFDRVLETRRRRSAVESLLALGYVWRDNKWVARAGGEWKLVPVEATPEMVAAAAAATWPMASMEDYEKAVVSAMIILRTNMDAAHGATLADIAAAIATMFAAYRAMVGAANMGVGS